MGGTLEVRRLLGLSAYAADKQKTSIDGIRIEGGFLFGGFTPPESSVLKAAIRRLDKG